MNKAIKKIELDLGGKTITLTPAQAKNLKEALDDLFGKKIVRVVEKEYIPAPYPVDRVLPYRTCPTWEWPKQEPYYETSKVTCSYTHDTGILSLTG